MAKEYGFCPVHILETWSEDLIVLMLRKMGERVERQNEAVRQADASTDGQGRFKTK